MFSYGIPKRPGRYPWKREKKGTEQNPIKKGKTSKDGVHKGSSFLSKSRLESKLHKILIIRIFRQTLTLTLALILAFIFMLTRRSW